MTAAKPLTVPRRAATAAAVAAALLAGCGDSQNSRSPSPSATPSAETQATPPPAVASIPQLVKRVSPSVVAITLTSGGEGSGVVWDEQGHIVTNNHVVDGVASVRIQTAAGKRVEGRVLATDPRTDLAVVKAENADLPPATFAEGLPNVGSLALAIGSPLGFENTVTAGIVSGLDRSLPTGGSEPSLVGLLQTDAPISPGNSGGALVGSSGQVIGVNVAYLPPQQTGAVSIGFAIPAPTVRTVVEQLIAKGRVDHPYLGVQLAPAVIGGEPTVIVAAVEPGSAAAAAGMLPRDIVKRLDDRDVTMIEDVYDALRGHKPGDRISVTIERGNAERTLTVTLGRLPTPASSALPGGGS